MLSLQTLFNDILRNDIPGGDSPRTAIRVPCMYESRVLGVYTEDPSDTQWFFLHAGEPQQGPDGRWFTLVPAQ